MRWLADVQASFLFVVVRTKYIHTFLCMSVCVSMSTCVYVLARRCPGLDPACCCVYKICVECARWGFVSVSMFLCACALARRRPGLVPVVCTENVQVRVRIYTYIHIYIDTYVLYM